MKRLFIILFTLLACGASVSAQVKPADLNKAVVNIITYDADGRLLHNAYGFLVGTTGEAVAPYQAFRGASRADIINWQGQTAQVNRIIGASSEYDLVRFTTTFATKKLIGLEAATAPAAKDQSVQVAFYSTDKKSLPATATVTAADLYNERYYYELSTPNENQYFGCPVLNAEGQVVALVQKNVQKDATSACAIDVGFATALSTNAVSAFNADLTDIRMPKQVPTNDEDAAFSYVYMMLKSGADSTLVVTAADDFIAAYPTNARIFNERATFYASHGNFAAATADLDRAVALGGETLADVYNMRSVLAYQKALNDPLPDSEEAAVYNDPWPAWNLDYALEAAEQAYATQPLPVYLFQQGHVLYAKQQYAEAFARYNAVCESDMASFQTYQYAATALERAGGDELQVVALLDSAINRAATPYTAEVAPALLSRAQHLDNLGQHRRATRDFDAYEKLVGARNLNAYFYYLRMQSEIGSKMYQQALDDALTAITRAATPEEKADYLFERACLQLQVGLVDESIASLTEVLSLQPDHAEANKVAGVAYAQKGQIAKAQQYLKRAVELGAENAEALLQKYK